MRGRRERKEKDREDKGRGRRLTGVKLLGEFEEEEDLSEPLPRDRKWRREYQERVGWGSQNWTGETRMIWDGSRIGCVYCFGWPPQAVRRRAVAICLVRVCGQQMAVSIDCGSSETFSDDNQITWVGDDELIQNGESFTVQSTKTTLPQYLTTLRAFPTRNKNCYAIEADKGSQLLVRASFFYGNYDKKSSPPMFDLQFDGNRWTTVVTSGDDLVYYEAIYSPKRGSTSVCVAQSFPNMVPFISAIEVRSLSSDMYGHVDSNHALFLRRRVAFGASDIIRFPTDPFDRIWIPAVNAAGFTELENEASLILVNLKDNPPKEVLQNAFAAPNTSIIITLGTNLPLTSVPIYMNMYFSEVTQLSSLDKRSFKLHINGEASSDELVPPFGVAGEVFLSNFSASSNTTFSLEATPDSTLPPLINALEVFTISDALTDGTHTTALQEEFSVLGDWQGDPCLPAPYAWDWINCTSDVTPRVTALHLSSFELSGRLPDFSSMTALETVDLHNNSLEGTIPEFLGTLPNLKLLNLADNLFIGPIPTSISKNSQLKLVITGNSELCASDKKCKTSETNKRSDDSTNSSSDDNKKSNKLPIILGVTIPLFVLIWIIAGLFLIMHQRRKSATIADNNNAVQNGGSKMNNNNGVGQGQAMNFQMVGQNVMNEFKVNIQDQDQDHNQTQHGDQMHDHDHDHNEV
ncbi:probable LRR receptor-like serine/threonine-protein kinase At1g05700 [Carica papaya]|uniref:probable LRR receptor-like serine/threonine-protein kinase At1g05700 n=1 Tax=Carica papaya TaxID=3649 RepID=UPI000B8D07D1|nr:probable LRR receptor-like serine/threonine-protein kinase At1g05700 [Carica papaya]